MLHDLEGRAKALEALNVFSSPRMGNLTSRITDLITNLLHLASQFGLDAKLIMERVSSHFGAESCPACGASYDFGSSETFKDGEHLITCGACGDRRRCK